VNRDFRLDAATQRIVFDSTFDLASLVSRGDATGLEGRNGGVDRLYAHVWLRVFASQIVRTVARQLEALDSGMP